MPQSLAKVLIHIVFSTKNRYPFLSDRETRNEMHAYLGGTCNHLDCQVLKVGGVADHVHILCALSRKIAVADLVGEIKRESSKWAKSFGSMMTKFSWQNGYGVFSVGETDRERVKHYIDSQEEHHSKKSFQEEYREALKVSGVDFDERYVWD